jgi:guanylate kinase
MKDKLIASERMKDFYKDVKYWIDYDFVVINDDLNRCYEEISNIINFLSFEKEKINYDKKFIEQHVKKLTS